MKWVPGGVVGTNGFASEGVRPSGLIDRPYYRLYVHNNTTYGCMDRRSHYMDDWRVRVFMTSGIIYSPSECLCIYGLLL